MNINHVTCYSFFRGGYVNYSRPKSPGVSSLKNGRAVPFFPMSDDFVYHNKDQAERRLSENIAIPAVIS